MAKQTRIPGTAHKHNEAVTNAALAYEQARNDRMQRTLKETEAREHLLETMREHKLDNYEDEDAGIRVDVVKPAVKVKVKRISEDDGEGEE